VASSRQQGLRVALVFLAAAAVTATIPMVSHGWLYAIVACLFLCWLVPVWTHWHRGILDFFEPIHIIGMISVVYFGLGAIWVVGDPENVAFDRYIVPYIPTATVLSLVAYLMLLAGYFGPWGPRILRRPTEEIPIGAMFMLIPGLIGMMGFLAAAAWRWTVLIGISLPAQISSLAQASPLFIFAWSLAWLQYFGGRASRSQYWTLFGIFVPGVLLIAFVSLNDKSLLVELAGIPMIALWYTRRKIPWRTLLLLLLILVFVVFPFNNTYRNLDARISSAQRLSMTANIISDWDSHQYLRRSIGTFKFRMSLINSVAVIVRDVPRWVPYAKGETFMLPTLIFLIPRFIWPDKPYYYFGRTFAEKFRIVSFLDKGTNVAPTFHGELYWNFDWPGVVLGMFLWGLALRWVYRRYGEREDLDPIARAIFIVLLLRFVHFEGGVVGQTVDVIRLAVMLELWRFVGRRLKLSRVVPTLPNPPLSPRRSAALGALKAPIG
jgi:hypothetical protein